MTADCPFAMKELHLPTCSHSKPPIKKQGISKQQTQETTCLYSPIWCPSISVIILDLHHEAIYKLLVLRIYVLTVVFLSDSRQGCWEIGPWLAWSWNIAHNVKQMASNMRISRHLTYRRDVWIWYNIQQKKEWPCLVCFDYLDLVHLSREHTSVLLIYRCLHCIWNWHIKNARWKTHIFGNIFREWQMCQQQMESQFDALIILSSA